MSFSPKVSVVSEDPAGAPTSFLVSVALEFLAGTTDSGSVGKLSLVGDWGESTSVDVDLRDGRTSVQASLGAKADQINLWWPNHYGQCVFGFIFCSSAF